MRTHIHLAIVMIARLEYKNMSDTRMKIKEIFQSRFDRIATLTDGSVYPFEAVGIRSAQYLGAQSTDPRASLSVDREGYTVETDD